MGIPLSLVPQPRGQKQSYFDPFKKLCNVPAPELNINYNFGIEEPEVEKKDKETRIVVKQLLNLVYKRNGVNRWVKGEKIVHVAESEQFYKRVRVRWREDWRNSFALIYDYSRANGPIYIIPSNVLFDSEFVEEKVKSEAYRNSGYTWSQPFPADKELPKLILNFKDKWDSLV